MYSVIKSYKEKLGHSWQLSDSIWVQVLLCTLDKHWLCYDKCRQQEDSQDYWLLMVFYLLVIFLFEKTQYYLFSIIPAWENIFSENIYIIYIKLL